MTRGAARALVACAVLALGCTTAEPILYPNETLRANGETRTDRDIAECAQLAEKYEAGPSPGREVASRTAEDAAAGGAAGAAGGAVLGNAGAGAATGAAAGAAGGLVHGIFHARREPSRSYRLFVQRCLEDRGYEVVGWK